MSYRRIPQNQQTELTAEARHDELIYELIVDRIVRTEVAVFQALLAEREKLYPRLEIHQLLPEAKEIASQIIDDAEERAHSAIYRYNRN